MMKTTTARYMRKRAAVMRRFLARFLLHAAPEGYAC
jgi:hypothetical protein